MAMTYIRELLGLDPKFEDYDPKDIEFQYISGATISDVIHIFYKKKHIWTYTWIRGVDAIRYSNLAKWHALYTEWERGENVQANASST